jgi:hypothetical protein
VRARLRLLDLFYGQRRFEVVQEGCLHRVHLEKVGMRNSASNAGIEDFRVSEPN